MSEEVRALERAIAAARRDPLGGKALLPLEVAEALLKVLAADARMDEPLKEGRAMSVAKKLDWSEWGGSGAGHWRAWTPFGSIYQVEQGYNGKWYWNLEGYQGGELSDEQWATSDEAKDAAQADFEYRLLSALEVDGIRVSEGAEITAPNVETSYS